MNSEEVMAAEAEYGANVYQRYPVVAREGRGVWLYDVDGRALLDCMAGYGVAILGHSHPRVVDAIARQAQHLVTCHGSLYAEVRARLLQALSARAPFPHAAAFLCNSGTEANEAALKLARKWTKRRHVVAFTGSFHGKTMGALATTWNPKYRRGYEELLSGVGFAPYGDLPKLRPLVSDATAAVLVEPVQGEAGIHVPPPDFLPGVRELCDQHGALLIVDEVQSGLGRTGRFWATQHWDVTPDILTVAKGMAGGVPMGAMLAKRELMNVWTPGDHTSTFGGNALACAAGLATLEAIDEESLVTRAEENGKRLKSGLEDLGRQRKLVREVRGLGLMIATELRFDIRNVLLRALEHGLLLLYSGRNVLRFLPPLVINAQEVEELLHRLGTVLAEEEAARMPKLAR